MLNKHERCPLPKALCKGSITLFHGTCQLQDMLRWKLKTSIDGTIIIREREKKRERTLTQLTRKDIFGKKYIQEAARALSVRKQRDKYRQGLIGCQQTLPTSSLTCTNSKAQTEKQFLIAVIRMQIYVRPLSYLRCFEENFLCNQTMTTLIGEFTLMEVNTSQQESVSQGS